MTAGQNKEFQNRIMKPGDEPLPGAGRPKGSPNVPKPLPPIYINKSDVPFVMTKRLRKDTVADYWNKQSPKALEYLFKRYTMFIMYESQGIPDPLGAKIFDMLSKELVKEIRTKAAKQREDNMGNTANDGAGIKKYKAELGRLKQSFNSEAEVVEEPDTDEGEFKPAESDTFSMIEDMDNPEIE